MNGNWAESDTRVVELPEDDPLILGLYIHCVYTNEIAVAPQNDGKTSLLDNRKFAKAFVLNAMDTICRLYCLAEKLQDYSTKKTAIEAVFEVQNVAAGIIAINTVVYVYKNTSENDPLRDLIVDLSSQKMADSLKINKRRLPKDFLGDLAVQLRSRLRDHEVVALKKGAKAYVDGLIQKEETPVASTI